MAQMEILGIKEQSHEYTKIEERVISFKLNNELIGIDIKKIIKITKDLDITPVPKTKDYILGVINLRGNIVPVVDLKKMLNLKDEKNSKENFILVIDSKLGHVGLVVDKIIGANSIEPDEIQPTPINSVGIDSKYLTGVVVAKDEESGEKNLLILLDIDKLFIDEEENSKEV